MMKVVEFINTLNIIGYDNNTELVFGVPSVILQKYIEFKIESIEDESVPNKTNPRNAISIDFDEDTVFKNK
jgi:hypothetical protein